MDTIVNRIIKINTLNLVSVFRNEDRETYHVLKVKKSKSKLDIISANTFLDLESLVMEIDRKIPLLLLIDGKGVLNKKIDLKNEVDIQWLKNIDYNTIHFLSYATSDNQFLSFCRQNVAEDILHTFQKRGFQIVDFYIGSITASLLIKNLKTNKIFSNESILHFDNEELTAIEKNTDFNEIKDYEIGDKLISNNHVPLYGAAVNFYIHHKRINKSRSAVINAEEIVYKKAFNQLGVIMITSVFVILLISYVLIQYYNAKNSQLNLENVYSNQSFELLQKLEEQKENKLKIVNETGIASSKFIAYYDYEIANSTPGQINLSCIDLFPVSKDIKATERVQFTSKTIIIKGSTFSETVFNSWLENIRNFKWIDNLEIVSIKNDKNNISHFELKIIIKDV